MHVAKTSPSKGDASEGGAGHHGLGGTFILTVGNKATDVFANEVECFLGHGVAEGIGCQRGIGFPGVNHGIDAAGSSYACGGGHDELRIE